MWNEVESLAAKIHLDAVNCAEWKWVTENLAYLKMDKKKMYLILISRYEYRKYLFYLCVRNTILSRMNNTVGVCKETDKIIYFQSPICLSYN